MPETGTLAAATAALGAAEIRSIEYSGTGRWFQFGQAPNPTLPWPPFDVSRFTAAVDYQVPAARVEMLRRQVVEPGRLRPAPAEQSPVQMVSGAFAWNLAMPPGAAAGTPPVPAPQPAAVEERTMEIWTTPHGFLKAAAANDATSTRSGDGSEVAFTIDGRYKYVGRINAQNEVERVQTWIDNTVLGDTPVDIVYSAYRDFGVEVDAYAPPAGSAPPPGPPNPFTVNLLENIERLGLNVRTIAALHGPRVATMDDLRAAAGRGTPATP
jgi:hypothetical protein